MLEFVLDQIHETAVDVGIGAVIWLVALLLPFRKLSAEKELRWDVIGYFGSAFFGLAIVIYLEGPLVDWSMPLVTDWRATFESLPWYVMLTISILVADFGMYWAHRALHSDQLWDSHAWHHSPRYLYFLSGTRAGPVHIIVLLVPSTLTYLLFPGPAGHWLALLQGGFNLANQHYLHSNLWFPFARQLEYVFVTPRMHFVHHSASRVHSDSNYGFVFSVWDRLFGSYTDPDTVPADEPLGLSYEISNWRAFWGLRPTSQAQQIQAATDETH